jgi:hypothetical protein
MRRRTTGPALERRTWGNVIPLRPVPRRRLAAPERSGAAETIDMAVIGRFLTEVAQRSRRGSVRIQRSARGRAWRVSAVHEQFGTLSASAPALELALEDVLHRLLPPPE